MTLDEAIKHCEEQVTKYERQCKFGFSKEGKEYNSQCAAEHRQLAGWLQELKERRAAVKRGKWLSRCEGDIYGFSECSECGNTESCETPYCAQCGARMGGDAE